jgi:arylsulfatase A-like enzyme
METKSRKKNNIVLINCDDMGYGDLACYGSTVNSTPYIDKLASEGMLFTDFYMASPVCSPSRASMLTGCYPNRIGFGDFGGNVVLFPGDSRGLNPSEKTIASVLKENGYSTMHIGKWHCGDQPEFLPTRHGFDHYYGLPYSNDMGRQIGKFTGACPLPLLKDENVIQQQPDLAALTERYAEQAVNFIHGNLDTPFFLYLAPFQVHLPHYAPDRFLKESKNGDFGGAIACLDWMVGVVTHTLKTCGLDENTLVIFTSDNGGKNVHGSSNGSLRGTKGSTWEGGMRVPCIFRWPGKIPSGSINRELSCSLDFFATFSKLAGIEPNGDLPDNDSIDISNFLFNGGTSPRSVFFYYHLSNLEAVRKGSWKLKIKDGDVSCKLLYNLCNDIEEKRNLYDEQPETVAELTGLINECRDNLGDRAMGIKGKNIRAVGCVDNPKMLTGYDPDYPYFAALYDKEERG